MNYRELGIASLYFALGHLILWFQANSQFIWSWPKDHKIILAIVLGVPASLLFMTGITHVAHATGNDMWATRIWPSLVGTLVFMIMTYLVFEQGLNLKNGICLMLTLSVLVIQIVWKN